MTGRRRTTSESASSSSSLSYTSSSDSYTTNHPAMQATSPEKPFPQQSSRYSPWPNQNPQMTRPTSSNEAGYLYPQTTAAPIPSNSTSVQVLPTDPYLCHQCLDKIHAQWPSCGDFTMELGSFEYLKGKNCNLCSLIATIDKVPIRSDIPPVPVESSQEISLTWSAKEKAFKVSHISHTGFGGTTIRIVRSTGPNEQFRTASLASEPYVSAGLIKAWLQRCRLNHQRTCPTMKNTGQPSEDTFIPLLFVDVVSMCLVRGSTLQRYLALSYCWGVVDEWRLRLMKSNREALMQDSALKRLESSIPVTILDAIYLTREIGERYLWVDSLCLVQDDSKELDKSIDLMGHIYEQSMLTIVAGSGTDAYSGLPGVNRVARKTLMAKAEIKKGIFISIIEDLDQHLRQSEYSHRAWTFQEELLSSRLLVFINNQVYFRCRGGNWSETTTLPGKDPVEHQRGVVDAMNTIFYEDSSFIDSFGDMIDYYHRRRMTFEDDLLRAIGGLMVRLASQKKGRFFEGLPLPLEQSLLFKTLPSIARGHDGIVRRRSSFPSWSWTGWNSAYRWYCTETNYGIQHDPPPSWITWYYRNNSIPKRLSSISQEDSISFQRSRIAFRYFNGRDLSSTIRSPPYPDEIDSRTKKKYQVLQFWTVSAAFRLEKVAEDVKSDNQKEDEARGIFYSNYSIQDREGNERGFLATDYKRLPTIIPTAELILLSECDCSADDYKITKSKTLAGSKGYWVMLITWLGPVAERRGIGRISHAAVQFAQTKVWKQITLG